MPFSTLARRSPHAGRFIIGLVQMFLIAINIKNIANGHIVFVTLFTVINSFVVVSVVQSMHGSTFRERVCYAGGSAIGVNSGIFFAHYIIRPNAFFHLAAAIINL